MFDSKLRCLVVVGSQWGDEGKGKLVDVLSEGADLVVRYQGGPMPAIPSSSGRPSSSSG